MWPTARSLSRRKPSAGTSICTVPTRTRRWPSRSRVLGWLTAGGAGGGGGGRRGRPRERGGGHIGKGRGCPAGGGPSPWSSPRPRSDRGRRTGRGRRVAFEPCNRSWGFLCRRGGGRGCCATGGPSVPSRGGQAGVGAYRSVRHRAAATGRGRDAGGTGPRLADVALLRCAEESGRLAYANGEEPGGGLPAAGKGFF